MALFHICQETLANVAKHAHPRHVNVAVWTTPNRVLLEVADDGRGFDVGQAPLSIGHGLSNIQTRADNAGGQLKSPPIQARGQPSWSGCQFRMKAPNNEKTPASRETQGIAKVATRACPRYVRCDRAAL